ncbi:hypothetical protein UCRPC4_g00692 [Phaeomoniella chlamydospora]|uniref:Uncharacterized protein n=1 Tax=Phaeomoniella chlamydospora TaxID=158046 RepID=A0A0G2F154_PHACM|nr:hypothetical protein UCRPC4_g00692 [Phaeomoniella chlamydospora]
MSSFSNIRFKLSDKETEWIEVPSERLQSSAYFQSLWERWQVLGGQFSAYSSDTLECELIIDIGQQKYYVTTSLQAEMLDNKAFRLAYPVAPIDRIYIQLSFLSEYGLRVEDDLYKRYACQFSWVAGLFRDAHILLIEFLVSTNESDYQVDYSVKMLREAMDLTILHYQRLYGPEIAPRWELKVDLVTMAPLFEGNAIWFLSFASTIKHGPLFTESVKQCIIQELLNEVRDRLPVNIYQACANLRRLWRYRAKFFLSRGCLGGFFPFYDDIIDRIWRASWSRRGSLLRPKVHRFFGMSKKSEIKGIHIGLLRQIMLGDDYQYDMFNGQGRECLNPVPALTQADYRFMMELSAESPSRLDDEGLMMIVRVLKLKNEDGRAVAKLRSLAKDIMGRVKEDVFEDDALVRHFLTVADFVVPWERLPWNQGLVDV